MQRKYQIGITQYDSDKQLWETHIGELNELGKPTLLKYSVWASTQMLSEQEAVHLINKLTVADLKYQP